MMKVLPQQLRLYAVTDSRRLQGRTLLDTVAAALDGGATFVQLREKELSPAALLEEARALAKLCHARHVPFVVDDNVEVALAAGATAYLLAWLAGAAIGDPTFRTGGLYLTAAIFGGAGAAGLLGSRPRKKRRDARPPIRKPVRRK